MIGRRTSLWWLFPVAVVVLLPGILPGPSRQAEATPVSGDTGNAGVQQFVSRPGLQPPVVTIATAPDRPLGSSLFLAPFRGDNQAGPMILDGRGRLVWFHPLSGEKEKAMNFRVQRYEGRPVLTWWEGTIDEAGYGLGEYVIADDHYREIARFTAGGGEPGDFHEYAITSRGTALITVYRPVHRDLSAIGGAKDGMLLESTVEEIDIASGRVLFTWHASDHVRLTESHQPVPTDPDEAFDFFHVNSIDVDDDGNLFVSSRHTSTVFKIDRDTGEVIWRLGGLRSDFALGPGAQFFSQHDARRQSDGSITLFDNGKPPLRHEHSRAIRLRVNTATMTATLEHQDVHPLALSSKRQGNAQALPDGSMFVGWGKQPYFSQFNAAGKVTFDAHLPEGRENYRAFRGRWAGHPTTQPAIAVSRDDDNVTVRASWNGATEVASWEVLVGGWPGDLRSVGSGTRHGFESAITVHTREPYAAVRALDRAGRLLGESLAVPTGRG